jgi:hypothetical protein
LQVDVPEAGLLQGDRLEPSDLLPNVADFDKLATPCTVMFWRPSAETHSRHRNLLFSATTGVTPELLVQDWLHTFSLGVAQSLLKQFFSGLLNADAWKVGDTQASLISMSIARLQAELFGWYGSESRSGRIHTRAQNLQPSMFGTLMNPNFTMRGAETNGVLRFSVELVARYGHLLSGPASWKRPIDAAVRILDLIKQHPWRFPPPAIQDEVHLCIFWLCVGALWGKCGHSLQMCLQCAQTLTHKMHKCKEFVDAAKMLVAATQKLGVDCTPEMHALLEMAARTSFKCNGKELLEDICN